jgi:hypothetical protein
LWKSERAIASIFGMKHLLEDDNQVYSNKGPRVKIGPAPGVIDIPYMYILKT